MIDPSPFAAPLQAAAQETPLWRLILDSIPLDASAIALYAILAGCGWLIWWANRRSRPGGHPPRDTDETSMSSATGEPPPTPGRGAPKGKRAA